MKFFIKINKIILVLLFGSSLFLLNGCESKKPKEEVTPTDPTSDSSSEFKWWVSSDSDCVKKYDVQGCNTCTQNIISGDNRGVLCTNKFCSETNKESAGKCLETCIKKYDKQGCNICTKSSTDWACTLVSCTKQDREKANVCLEIKKVD